VGPKPSDGLEPSNPSPDIRAAAGGRRRRGALRAASSVVVAFAVQTRHLRRDRLIRNGGAHGGCGLAREAEVDPRSDPRERDRGLRQAL
jgi:hypothetical protein